jgi:hypothetical protein
MSAREQARRNIENIATILASAMLRATPITAVDTHRQSAIVLAAVEMAEQIARRVTNLKLGWLFDPAREEG